MKVFSNKGLAIIVSIVMLLITAAFFMVNVEMPAWAHYVSGINVILFAIPVFWATTKWLGTRDAIILFAVIGILALTIETAAVLTGFPYGHFGYSDLLGYRLFGYVPWTVSLAWTPLVLAAYSIGARMFEKQLSAISFEPSARIRRVAITAMTLVVFDLVLDPGAVRLGFWQYEGGGFFYGVPLSNFMGWLITGAVAGMLLEAFFTILKPLLPVPVQLLSSAFFITAFWSAIAFFGGMYVPFAIGAGVLVLVGTFYLTYYFAYDDMIVMVDEHNNAIGTAQRRSAHNDETNLHRAFSVFIFNSEGELLLQQRALTKKTWPGVWSNSCCGHVMLHESTEAAVRRRLKYELGLDVGKLDLVLPDFRYRAEKDGVVENEICPVFVAFCDTEPKPNPTEVNDIRWVPWVQFAEDLKDPANGYSPWAREEVELLMQIERFRVLGVRI